MPDSTGSSSGGPIITCGDEGYMLPVDHIFSEEVLTEYNQYKESNPKVIDTIDPRMHLGLRHIYYFFFNYSFLFT